MVTNEVWKGEAGLDYNAGLSHITCLENRIGRKLTRKDVSGYTEHELVCIDRLSGHSYLREVLSRN